MGAGVLTLHISTWGLDKESIKRAALRSSRFSGTGGVFVDFGHEVVWSLVFFDAIKKAGVVGPINKEALVTDLIQGTPLARIRSGAK